jgi:hypothetical protein
MKSAGGDVMEKIIPKKTRASNDFERLAFTNRQEAQEQHLKISSFSNEENKKLSQIIQKNAHDINTTLLQKQGEHLSKFAMPGDINLFSQATGLVANKLGIDPQNSHEIVSKLMQDVDKIQQRFGGSPNSILNRLIDEMQNVMMQNNQSTAQNSHSELQKTHDNISFPISAKQTEDSIKFLLMQTMSMSSVEAERLSKNIITEAKDLRVQVRPYNLAEISEGIVHLVHKYNDATIVYGLRNNRTLIPELKTILQQRG